MSNQKLLGDLFAQTTTAMLLVDDERRYVAANDAACLLLGIERDELLEMRIEDLAAPELRDAVADQWKAFIAEGSQSGPYRLETPDGRVVETLYSATANVAPGFHLSVFVAPDLAEPELDLAQAAADEAGAPQAPQSDRDALLVLIGNSSTAMLVIDDDRRFVAANDAFLKLMETTEGEIRDLRLEDVLPQPLRSDVTSRFERFLDSGSQWGPVQLTTFKGRQLAVIYSATASVRPGRHLIELLHRSRREPEFNFSPDGRLGRPEGGSLSTRERQVLSLLALGETNQSIAARLNLSPETVRNHTRSARNKLGARSRSHAIAIAVQTGQLDLAADPADPQP